MGEMKFPETKIGEMATQVEQILSQEASQMGTGIGMQKIAPLAESVEQVAGQVARFAEKNWPKPPHRMASSTSFRMPTARFAGRCS